MNNRKTEVKIAILIDEAVDEKVSREYFRKKPDAFPFLWLRMIIDPGWENYCIGRLRELTDEKQVITHMRELLASPVGEMSSKIMQEQIDHIKEISNMEKNSKSLDLSKITGVQLACLLVIHRVKKLGIPSEKLHSFIAWLPRVMPRAFELVTLGFQAFIITDLKGNHALWSDGDLADDLFLAADKKPEANIVICLNDPVNKIYDVMGFERREVKFHIYHGYLELSDKISL